MAVVNNGLLTVRIVSNAGVYPVFACEQLADGQSFTVEIVDFTMKFFMIGVATSSLRNIKN
jgi:hypothetical protein